MRKELKLSKNGAVKPPTKHLFVDQGVQLLNKYVQIFNNELKERHYNGQELKYTRYFDLSEIQIRDDLAAIFALEGWKTLKTDNRNEHSLKVYL